jgi:quercetin dioxygenase-like cupin family protein
MTQQNQSAEKTSHKPGITTSTGGTPGKPAGEYKVKQRETLAEAPGLRVRILALLKGQIVPWHYHNSITDTFFCMRGPMRILTRTPDASHTLYAGDTLAVSPGTPHYVECIGTAECQFMIIQGVGKYDYVPIRD